jgi:predicted lipoprotein
MLQDLAGVVILPAHDQLVVDAAALAEAAAALEVARSDVALATTQEAWRRARAAWKQSEAFAIGPAETLRTAAKIDFAPVRPDRIESEIAGGQPLTSAHVDELGANVKGFLALEYVLFDPEGGDAAVLERLAAERRRSYARALAENLRDEVTKLRDAWAPGGGNFAAELTSAGQGSATFPTLKSAVDELVNQLIFLAEDVADAQPLAALGTRDGGAPRPEAIDANRSENGLADLLDNLAGIQSVYFGAYGGREGRGFRGVVVEISPDVEGAIGLAIRRALETAARIPAPLERAVSDDRALVERAQVRAKELMRSLEIDLVSILGTTLRFNPSDGD